MIAGNTGPPAKGVARTLKITERRVNGYNVVGLVDAKKEQLPAANGGKKHKK